MRFVALGYLDEARWEAASPQEQQAFLDRCFAYDDVLREGGHFAGGEALSGPARARTVRHRGGEVAILDGPFAETKEVLGGLLFLEADDFEHAVALMAKHPGAAMGCFEVRPIEDLSELERESRARRS